uniref:Uncharacterized protein n=1 Tax=Arundo donax TaxID=35708 RepID=A0A0A9HQR2_ARUDO
MSECRYLRLLLHRPFSNVCQNFIHTFLIILLAYSSHNSETTGHAMNIHLGDAVTKRAHLWFVCPIRPR